MSGTEVFLLVMLGLSWAAVLAMQFFAYRDGFRAGYGAGYDDRDDEVIYGEKFGTRRGRTTR